VDMVEEYCQNRVLSVTHGRDRRRARDGSQGCSSRPARTVPVLILRSGRVGVRYHNEAVSCASIFKYVIDTAIGSRICSGEICLARPSSASPTHDADIICVIYIGDRHIVATNISPQGRPQKFSGERLCRAGPPGSTVPAIPSETRASAVGGNNNALV